MTSPAHRALRKQIAAFIKDYSGRLGYSPSTGEIAASLGYGSITGVTHHLRAMEAEGLVTRAPRVPRSLVLTPAGEALLDEQLTA